MASSPWSQKATPGKQPHYPLLEANNPWIHSLSMELKKFNTCKILSGVICLVWNLNCSTPHKKGRPKISLVWSFLVQKGNQVVCSPFPSDVFPQFICLVWNLNSSTPHKTKGRTWISLVWSFLVQKGNQVVCSPFPSVVFPQCLI